MLSRIPITQASPQIAHLTVGGAPGTESALSRAAYLPPNICSCVCSWNVRGDGHTLGLTLLWWGIRGVLCMGLKIKPSSPACKAHAQLFEISSDPDRLFYQWNEGLETLL